MGHQRNDQPRSQIIVGGRVVTPERPDFGSEVLVRGGEIVAIDPEGPTSADRRIDVDGRLVLPGFVDIHGDDIETQLEPRAGAEVDPAFALAVCDRINLAAGVTTKFHAVAFEESPGDRRSIERATTVLDTIERDSQLLADHRVNARCEIGDAAAVQAVVESIGRTSVDLVSLMNHVPGNGQYADLETFTREYSTSDRTGTGAASSLARRRQRVDKERLQTHVGSVISHACTTGIPVASHDDDEPSDVQELFVRGVDLCEFPTTLAAAMQANELGLPVCMGAPNLVRGGSLWENLSVHDAVDAGAVDILCTDYHPPSLLHGLFVDTGEPLERRLSRVTDAPAHAVGLEDRGRLEPGYRADMVVVDPGAPPVVERVFVGGNEVYRAGDRVSGSFQRGAKQANPGK